MSITQGLIFRAGFYLLQRDNSNCNVFVMWLFLDSNGFVIHLLYAVYELSKVQRWLCISMRDSISMGAKADFIPSGPAGGNQGAWVVFSLPTSA